MATTRARSTDVITLRHLAAQPAARRTQALIKADSLELVQLVLPGGAELHEHAAPGEITLLGLQGCLLLRLADRTLRLEAGDLVHLAAGEPHAVQAETDSRALLTLCLHRAPPAAASSRPAVAAAQDPGLRGAAPSPCGPEPGAAAACGQPDPNF